MSQEPSFAANLISVIAGVLFLVMTAAFILMPYTMSGHPGESYSQGAKTEFFHPT